MEVESKKFKFETAHNSILFNQQQQLLELRSHDNALQGLIDLRAPQQLKLKNLEYLMAVLLFIPTPKRILMLGTAAGALIHFLRHHHPLAQITAVDIDTELIEQLLTMHVLPPAGAGLRYIHDDARHFMSVCQQRYDLILVDIFIGAESPDWLLQNDKIERLYQMLSPSGALAYNLLIGSEHQFRKFYRSLRQNFAKRTLCLPVTGFENTLAFAMRYEVPARDMAWYRQHAQNQSEILGVDLVQPMSAIYNTNPIGQGVIY